MLHPAKLLLSATAALCLSVAALAAPPSDGATWFADYDEAAAEAARTGKDLLVDFTGSDWCIWCKRLDGEVFKFEAFQKGVENEFVLVALDFPNADDIKAKVPNPQRNEELKNQYGIQGFPTVLLMTAQGEVYAKTGYQAGGPEKYVASLTELRTSGKRALAQVGALKTEFDAATGDAKLAAWDKLAELALTLDEGSPFGGQLVMPLKQAFMLDADNAQGRKLRAVKALMALGQSDAELIAIVKEMDPANAEGLLEMTLAAQFGGVRDDITARAAIEALAAFETAAKFQDTELQTQLCTNAALWLAGPLQDAEAAKPWARKALDLKPANPEQVAMLEQVLAGG